MNKAPVMLASATTASAQRQAHCKSGFALVVTLSLMILLTIIAVGLLSLSSISLRSTSQGEAMAVAMSNARLGLMLAIGEIQKSLGPDQKICAVSEILNAGAASGTPLKNSHLTGVWRSRQDALGDAPDYDQEKAFECWLVSSSRPEDLLKSEFAKSGGFDNPVRMVAGHGSGKQAAYAGMIEIPSTNPTIKSGMAWWVGDENSKGFTNPEDTLAKESAAPAVPDILAAAGTPGAFGMQAIDKAYPANTTTIAKVLTHGQLALAAADADTRDWFHDLSPYPRGLLTNVAKGGWRQDLNLYLEQTRAADPWPGNPAPLGPNGKFALSVTSDYDVLAWKYLYNYYHLKERISLTGGRPFLRAWSGANGVSADDLTNPAWNSGSLRPTPVLVRAVIFIAFGSIPNPTNPSQYVLRFYGYPVITLWNPFNVDLKVESQQLNYLFTSLPMGHKIYVNGQFREVFTWRGDKTGGSNGANNYNGSGFKPVLNKSITLLAGEARMLCSTGWAWNPTIPIHQNHLMEDQPFNYSQSSSGGQCGVGGGHDQQIIQSTGAASDRVKIETFVNLWDSDGGAFLRAYPATFDIRGNHAPGDEGNWPTFQWGQKLTWLHESTTPAVASPDRLSRSNEPTATFGEVLGAPRPFMAVDVQLKALDEADFPNKTWRDCVPSHPYQGVTKGLGDVTPYLANAYKLTFSTINSYQEAATYLQVAPDNPVHTYFGGSYFPSGGQSWITDREIPLAPFTSLAQLQHLPQTSADNLYSSGFYFQNRAIGNSFASPGVPSDKVKTNGWPFNVDFYMNSVGGNIDGVKYAGDYFHTRPNIDRSYAANHLLWDDYFFSSMAAQNDVLRATGARRGLDRVIKEFYESGTPLPNQRYRPYLDKAPPDVIKRLLTGTRPTPNGYKDVAANLMVDGAFNINSVSVPAWKTLLATAHRRNMVVMEGTGGKPTDAGPKNFVVSRFSMPNKEATSGTGGADPRWQGYHELTETQLGELAEAIVRQVKLRGPFRSLAEFINRRLGPESDERTKYGTLQAALEDPRVSINAQFRAPEITAANINGATYQNPTAALGPRYQGSPPCVTQADLLNTIGPVLNARSDTFLIRAYGEARDASGKVLASAWCEAVVQRIPDFLNSSDASTTAFASLKTPINKVFGRRFNLVGFRWLSKNEL